jgi:hypothetical protein
MRALKSRRSFLALLLALFPLLLASSCARFRAEHWQSEDTPGKCKASFSFYEGEFSCTFEAKRDDVLSASYNVHLESGSLSISLKDRKGTVWQKSFSVGDSTEDLQFTLRESGKCKFVFEGNRARGNFLVTHRTEPPKI